MPVDCQRFLGTFSDVSRPHDDTRCFSGYAGYGNSTSPLVDLLGIVLLIPEIPCVRLIELIQAYAGVKRKILGVEIRLDDVSSDR